ncbi:MAG: DUF420 domain-containing protein [Deltaproteobacteria bacterium]|nr:DUF420 domain-containing protein [Deltaproteobacteria bacterium]
MDHLPLHPTLNASLNALSALLLIGGGISIKLKKETVHRTFMVSAFLSSTAFLVSYLIYHATQLATPFNGQGTIRTVYFAILLSHIVLAVVMVPLILITLKRGADGKRALHKKIAHVTLPMWLYVSVTGVVVYWFLYIGYPAA